MASLMERREQLRQEVERVLASEREGRLTLTRESAAIDFKEEAGRRHGADLEPGTAENTMAATKLADEVACMANSPGGGALILGVEDHSGIILGTELDVDWLRQRIHRAVDVAPDIEEHRIAGQRVLVLYVAQAQEPVEDTKGRLRWRVGDSCQPVDRAEWWLQRESMRRVDPMAQPSSLTDEDVTEGAIALIRTDLGADPTETTPDILRRLGALRADGYLTQAAALMFAPTERDLVDLTVIDVPGGQLINVVSPGAGLSLREQIDVIERALATRNDFSSASRDGFSQQRQRMIPESATREAILNGLVHRHWDSHEATHVRWIQQDATLEVVSPGGFTGGVDATNVLSHRHSRYPALADLCRALGLVEKQGLGVDRMYAAMIRLGHRPPTIVQRPGPVVECVLRGGDPVVPIGELFAQIVPLPRQRDVRVALIVDALLRRPFLTVEEVAALLQTDSQGAEAALRAALQCTVSDEPLIALYKDAWILGETARHIALPARQGSWLMPVLTYVNSSVEACEQVALAWVAAFESVMTGDVMRVTGSSRGTAQKALADLVERGRMKRLGAGRSTEYVAVRDSAGQS